MQMPAGIGSRAEHFTNPTGESRIGVVSLYTNWKMKKTVEGLIAEVRASRERVLELISAFTPEQGKWKPAPDQWSAVEIVEHLVLAEHAGINRIWQAADAVKVKGPLDNSVNRGLSIEDVIARTWKPLEQAPPEATPLGVGPLAYWAAYFRSCQTVLATLGERLDGMDLSTIVFPHFLCGPLDVRQRLEFLRFHMDRHAEQIRRLGRLRT